MSFSKKKVIYGGMATACVALMVFAVSPYSRLETTQARIESNFAATDIKSTKRKWLEKAVTMLIANY